MEVKKRTSQGMTLLLVFGAVIFGMVLAGGLSLTVPSLGLSEDDDNTGARVAAHAQASIASFADLAEAVLPAVVSVQATTIEVLDERGGGGSRDLFERFFQQQRRPGTSEPREFRQDGGGSGFVISEDGWIVTNYHVIQGATKVVVRFDDGGELEAEVKGHDAATDIAVLKMEGEGFPYLDLGDSEALRVGDWVMAIGNPHGLSHSVTVGVVSAKGRDGTGLVERSFENFIQTDAAINRGNSGGPIVDTSGRVVGIATAMNFGAENIGFAVPVTTLEDVLPQLRSDGKVTRGYLGVNIRDIEPREVRGFRGLESADGALVLRVMEDTPADKAGLRQGDVVLRVDGRKIGTTDDLIGYVARQRPGTKVELDILRSGRRVDKTVTLEERDQVAEVEPDDEDSEENELEWLGLQYQDLTQEIRSMAGIPRSLDGVLVTDLLPSSPLYDEGVRPGDVLAEVNGEEIEGSDDFERVIAATASGDFLRFYYVQTTRQGTAANFAIVEVP